MVISYTFYCPAKFKKHFVGELHANGGFHFKRGKDEVQSAIVIKKHGRNFITRITPDSGGRPELKENEILFSGDEIWRGQIHVLTIYRIILLSYLQLKDKIFTRRNARDK